jgi:undecaprenyl diphosphate synthase
MHIAIIMDGNGRWAAERDLPRSAGHRAGAKAVESIVETAARQGIRTLTLYAFSAANWDRPRAEVSALFVLLRRYLLEETPRCLERGIRLNVIGRRDRLDPRLREVVEHSERATAHGAGMHLRIAVDYSSQASLLEVGRRLRAVPVADRSRFLEELAAVDHSSPAAPEVDLLIRTGGEKRLSDFLLWEAAYAELYFVDCLWPDFDAREFSLALDEFARRDRRFGRIVENPQQIARRGNG